MNSKPKTAAAVGLVLVSASLSVRGDDAPPPKVGNPLYAAWAKFDLGASVACEYEVTTDGGTGTIPETLTLKEKSDNAVKLESPALVGDIKRDSFTVTYPAKAEASDVKQVGQEEIKIGEKTYKCKVYEIGPSAMGDSDMAKAKVWLCDDVPGGVVKEVIPVKDSEIKSQMTSFKIK